MRWWHSSKDRVVRLLVDTRILLWAAAEPERLPASFRERLESPANEVFFYRCTTATRSTGC
jgi:PIN domain nuclease of toxin-antitoxin system